MNGLAIFWVRISIRCGAACSSPFHFGWLFSAKHQFIMIYTTGHASSDVLRVSSETWSPNAWGNRELVWSFSGRRERFGVSMNMKWQNSVMNLFMKWRVGNRSYLDIFADGSTRSNQLLDLRVAHRHVRYAQETTKLQWAFTLNKRLKCFELIVRVSLWLVSEEIRSSRVVIPFTFTHVYRYQFACSTRLIECVEFQRFEFSDDTCDK